ncbi:MAG: DMT family transporter [Betaproteobacteria bacterium]|nr:DMT family transporter [Betaproteobacteria bacterium]
MTESRTLAFLLLAAASLMWSGNWITGRALRDAYDPFTLNFGRWLVAAALLAPFALPRLRGRWSAVRKGAGRLFLLALTGVVLFQSLIYLGLRTTTAVNGVLINSSMPLFMILCSWALEGDRASPRQVAGMLVSLVGILVIVSHGSPANLLRLEARPGDGWILLAMPVWGLYSVLLKRRPPGLDGLTLLFVLSLIGLAILAPVVAFEASGHPLHLPTPMQALGVAYMGSAASVVAFTCWNKGVSVVGANAAGFTVHLLPAFGTVLAIAFLGEAFQAYHAAGIATILVGVVLATRMIR